MVTDQKKSAFTIPLEDETCKLSIEQLSKYKGPTSKRHEWPCPSLQFISFKNGELHLLNSSEGKSFNLILSVCKQHLNIMCSCGNTSAHLCEHAYSAVWEILWHNRENYFRKLLPEGSLALAFQYPRYFDKKESKTGIDTAPRAELGPVYQLTEGFQNMDLHDSLALPGEEKCSSHAPGEGLGYMILLPYRRKMFPAIVPCSGKLNLQGTEIKSWDSFETALKKSQKAPSTESQKKLNLAAHDLWKLVEKIPGWMLIQEEDTDPKPPLKKIFDLWEQALPLLKKQQLVYAYYFYGPKELKLRPKKERTQKIFISGERPRIHFELSDKGVFYQLRLIITVNDKPIDDYDAGYTFLIIHYESIYLLESVRDAALVEWMDENGRWITVFKEHYADFEKKVLEPLGKYYVIERKKSKKK
ncbi:MAG: hypothetical protein JWN76_2848 [Chitinophagaceae bacterium]|nr:hypothetical protein [Chitinophagaceae bacterium]